MLYAKSKSDELDLKLFKNPTSEYRGAPFWAWNCRLEREELLRQIEVFKKMGFGGFQMHSRTGLATEYLGREYMELVAACVEKAKAENMLAWLYDEDRWPSGFAGGIVTENEEFRGRNLLFAPEPAGGGTFLARYGIRLDGQGCLAGYRMLEEGGASVTGSAEEAGETGEAGTGRAGTGEADEIGESIWYACIEIYPNMPWFGGQTYADTLNPRAVEAFIASTYERYKDAVGGGFGSAVPAVFTDEPNYAWRIENLKRSSDKTPLRFPWTDDLPATYEAACGIPLLPRLPELFWNLPGGRPSEARYHYYNHLAERFARSFAGTVGEWCKKNNILFAGHLMNEDDLNGQSTSIGEAMRCYKYFGLPGIDVLADHRLYNTAKQAQSAVRQFGREGMLSELNGISTYDYDFRRYKLHGDWQAALGVTARVPHLSMLSMKGDAKRDYPPSINYQQPWHGEYSMIEDHFARVASAMTRGKAAARIGVIHPLESYWLHMGGPNDQSASAREKMEAMFGQLAEWLLFGQLDFDFISEALLPEQCLEAGCPLKVGEMGYDAVIISGCRTIRGTTADRLRKFARLGGSVIVAGAPPELVDLAPEGGRLDFLKDAKNIPFDSNSLLQALEPFRDIDMRDANGERVSHLLTSVRVDGDKRWLFAANGKAGKAGKEQVFADSAAPMDIRLSINGCWSAMRYDTLSGEAMPQEAVIAGGKTVIFRTMHTHDSLLLCLAPAAVEAATKSEAAAGWLVASGEAAAGKLATGELVVAGKLATEAIAATKAEAVASLPVAAGKPAAGEAAAGRAAIQPKRPEHGYSQHALLRHFAPAVPQFSGGGCIAEAGIELSEPNAFLLDMAEYALDGGGWRPADDTLRIKYRLAKELGIGRDTLRCEQPWVRQGQGQPEKPSHCLSLRYAINCEYVPKTTHFALEDADVAGISLNGRAVRPVADGWYVDRAIEKVRLPRLKKGQNILEINVPFGPATDLEWRYLLGDFGVRVAGAAKTVTGPVRQLAFGDITAQGLPFYGGNILYKLPVESDGGGIRVRVPYYRGALVGVLLDGERIGSVVFDPYAFDIPAMPAGSHELGLLLFGHRYNAMGCVHRHDTNSRWLTPAAWLTSGDLWSYEYVLKPVGIMKSPDIEMING